MRKRLLLLSVAMLTAMCAFAQNETRRFSERENRNEREVRSGMFFQSERENRNEQEARISPFSMRENAKPELRNNRISPALRANAIKHRLDSIVAVEARDMGSERRELEAFEYDDYGRVIAAIERIWLGDMHSGMKRELTYHCNGNLTIIFYRYQDSAWEEDWKEEYSFDNSENRTTVIGYSWSGNEWEIDAKQEWVLDSNGNEILYVFYRYLGNNAWRGVQRETHTFDSNGNAIMSIFYSWDFANSVWVQSTKTERTFDHNNKRTLVVDSWWDRNNNVWVLFDGGIQFRYEYTYSDGRITEWIRYIRFDGAAEWMRTNRYVFEYDNNGNRVVESIYWWDWSGVWTGVEKNERTFDASGNMTMMIISRWDWDDENWAANRRYVYEFDSSVSWDEVLWPHIQCLMLEIIKIREIDFEFFNKPTGARSYDWINNAWELQGTLTCYYYLMSTTTSCPIIPASVISIFPNPASDYFTISGLTENTLVTVTNLTGQIVLQQTVLPNESVSVNHLPAGIYIVSVNGQSQRLIVR